MLEADFLADDLILHQRGTDVLQPGVTRAKHILFHGSQEGKRAESELLHFAHCINTGATPDTDGRSSLQSLRVIWRLYEAEHHNVVADLTGLGLDEVEQPLQLRVNQMPIVPSAQARGN